MLKKRFLRLTFTSKKGFSKFQHEIKNPEDNLLRA